MEQIVDLHENRQNKTTKYRTIIALGLLSALVSIAAHASLTIYLGPFFMLLVTDMHREYVQSWQSLHWLVIAWKVTVYSVFLAPIIIMHLYRVKNPHIGYFKLVIPAFAINCLSLVMVVALFDYFILLGSQFSYLEILYKGDPMILTPFLSAIVLNFVLPFMLQRVKFFRKELPANI